MFRAARRALAVLAGLTCVALPASALAAPPAGSAACVGTLPPGTYASIYVPPNGSCTLNDVRILGDATADTGSSLILFTNGSIGGDLTAASGSQVYEDTGWTVDGATSGASNTILTLDGTVRNVRLYQASGLYMQNATVRGSIAAARTQAGSIFASTIAGDVTITGTPAGNPGWTVSGPGQTIGGNVLVLGNQSPTDVDTNEIRRNLACYGNTPPTINYANIVRGQSLGQCATPTPVPGA